MTWKEKRLVTILSSVLLVLLAAIVVVLGLRYRASRPAEETPGTEAGDVSAIVSDSEFVALEYSGGAFTLSFSRAENAPWTWDGDKNFPLDDAVITSILALVTEFKTQQTLTDEASLSGSGLGEPSGYLNATAADGSVTTLLFGKATTDGTSRYVRKNEDETTVYILDGALFEKLSVPVYDMCRLPAIPQLQEERMQNITLRGPVAGDEQTGPLTILTAQQADGGEDTSWRANGANVTDLPAVRGLIRDLEAMALARCVNFNPSEEAVSLCGFDNPAILTVSYLTEGGADQIFKLTVGGELPDGSGRYVRLENDTTMYLVTPELLDPMLQLAATGLE